MDALILGASPNALSAARSLGRSGLEVVIAAAKINQTFKRSRYVERTENLEEKEDAAIASHLMELPKPHERPFLLATGDRYALLVARFQNQLKSKYCFVCPSYVAIEAIIDKAKLYETAKRNGFPHPKFSVVRESTDVDEAIANIPTPCYVKPALAHEWRLIKPSKLERADNEGQLRRILDRFIEAGLVAIPMEIIPGDDGDVVSLSTYIDGSGRPLGWRTKRKLRQYPVNAGDASAQEVCDQPDVAELGLRLLSITGHRGPATVEFRRDQRNGRFVLMEINARTILGQEMITRSGLDVPLIAYHDAKGTPVPAMGPARPIRWIHFGSDFQAFKELRRTGRITTLEWIKSIAPADPLPTLHSMIPDPSSQEYCGGWVAGGHGRDPDEVGLWDRLQIRS